MSYNYITIALTSVYGSKCKIWVPIRIKAKLWGCSKAMPVDERNNFGEKIMWDGVPKSKILTPKIGGETFVHPFLF